MSGLDAAGVPQLDSGASVRTFATDLKKATKSIDTRAGLIQRTWLGLVSSYQAPEDTLVWNAVAAPATSAADLDTKTATAQTALDTYADTLDALAIQRAAVITAIADANKAWAAADDVGTEGFSTSTAHGYGVSVGTTNEPQTKVAEAAESDALGKITAFAAAVDEAQRTCANAIGLIWGMPAFKAADESAVDYKYKFGMSADGYEATTKTGDAPWKSPRGWKDPATILDYAIIGAGEDIKDSVVGLGHLLGIGDDGKVEATRSGTKEFLYSLGVLMGSGQVAQSDPDFVTSPEYKHAQDVVGESVKGMVYWHQWDTAPAQAGGAIGFNVALTLATMGTAGAVKGGISAFAKLMKIPGIPSVARSITRLGELAGSPALKGLTKIGDLEGVKSLRTLARDGGYKLGDTAAATSSAVKHTIENAATRARNGLHDLGRNLAPDPVPAGGPSHVPTPRHVDPPGRTEFRAGETTTGWPRGHGPGETSVKKTYSYQGDSVTGTGMKGEPPAVHDTVKIGFGANKDGIKMPKAGDAFGSKGEKLAANTEYVVRGRGIFYTDHTSKITFVEPMRREWSIGGKRLSYQAMSSDLRKPLPDVTYYVDDYAYFHTDARGLTDHVYVDAVEELGDTRRSTLAQHNVAGDYPDEDAGHLIGRDRGGPREEINLVRMLREMNRGTGDFKGKPNSWAAVERTLRQETNNPSGPPRFDVRVFWDTAGERPESFRVVIKPSDAPARVTRLANPKS